MFLLLICTVVRVTQTTAFKFSSIVVSIFVLFFSFFFLYASDYCSELDRTIIEAESGTRVSLHYVDFSFM